MAILNEGEIIEFTNKNSSQRSSNQSLKKTILGLIIAVAVIITLLVLNDSPGSGLGMLAIPLMPIVWIFYPVYFTILALRYSREKSNMDPLDKITFYLLLVHIGGFFIFALSTLAK